MANLVSYFWVALGGSLGSMARYWLSQVAAQIAGETFPWGTLLVNILGSFVIGWFSPQPASEGMRLFVMVGICGGFTTFSAFSIQNSQLVARRREPVGAGLHLLPRFCFASLRP